LDVDDQRLIIRVSGHDDLSGPCMLGGVGQGLGGDEVGRGLDMCRKRSPGTSTETGVMLRCASAAIAAWSPRFVRMLGWTPAASSRSSARPSLAWARASGTQGMVALPRASRSGTGPSPSRHVPELPMTATDQRTWLQTAHQLVTQLRIDSIPMTSAAGSGHPTSSVSAADIMAVLVTRHQRIDGW
jgi:hypothetical protein